MAKNVDEFFWKVANEVIIDAMTHYFQTEPECGGAREVSVMELIGYCAEMRSKSRVLLDTRDEEK